MLLTTEFLNKVLNQFDSDLLDEQQHTNELDAKTEWIDNNHLIISITRKVNPNKKKFDEFIDNCSAFQWEYILNNFERITGKSLQEINRLYTNKQYDTILQLFDMTTKEIANEFNSLVNKK